MIARKDMPTSYHLAVVVDDAHQHVSLVTRGEDLLSATHIQRLLQALLKLPEPAYAHHSAGAGREGQEILQARRRRQPAEPARSRRYPGRHPGPDWALASGLVLRDAPCPTPSTACSPPSPPARAPIRQSYTAKLLAAGVEKCAKKFGEEATEAVIAAIQKDKTELAKESADVLYHLVVLWAASGITPDDVYAVLRRQPRRAPVWVHGETRKRRAAARVG